MCDFSTIELYLTEMKLKETLRGQSGQQSVVAVNNEQSIINRFKKNR